MIESVHTMFNTSDAAATRAFLRDKLAFPSTDVGDGRLIFEMPGGVEVEVQLCQPRYTKDFSA